jgi:hypothetical protein
MESVEPAQLGGDRIGDLSSAVSDAAVLQARHRVDVAPPLVIDDDRTLTEGDRGEPFAGGG